MSTLLYLLLTLVLLSIMVVIHELGHFLFAKLFKVKILEFSVGMGPAIFTTKRKSQKENKLEIAPSLYKSDAEQNNDSIDQEPPSETVTEPKSEADLTVDENNDDEKTAFSIRALPIGGYVSMAGEDDASTDVNAFCNKPAWQRLIITVAGPVMNILLGIICMFSLVLMECGQSVDVETGYSILASTTVYSFNEASTSNTGSEPLQAGDRIIKIDGITVHTGNEVVYEIMNSGYEPIDLVVERNGEIITLHDVTFPTFASNGATFGDMDFRVYGERATFKTIMKHAFFRSVSTVKTIVDSLKDLIGGRYGADAVSGPVGMADAVGQATKSGAYSLLYLFTLITMNLGVFNLLPFPALDGGRIIFILIEMIIRKPVKKEFEQAVNTVGILLLFALMIFVTLKDIVTLF